MKTILQRLDDFANLTGFPAWSKKMGDGARPRRHLRWLPGFTLTLATAGLVLAFAIPHRVWLGYIMLIAANAVAMWLPLFGPVKPWGTLKGVDERDRQLRRDAYFVTFATISAIAPFGLLLLIALMLLNRPDLGTQALAISTLIFYLLVLWATVPTLYASWMTRPIDDE